MNGRLRDWTSAGVTCCISESVPAMANVNIDKALNVH